MNGSRPVNRRHERGGVRTRVLVAALLSVSLNLVAVDLPVAAIVWPHRYITKRRHSFGHFPGYIDEERARELVTSKSGLEFPRFGGHLDLPLFPWGGGSGVRRR